MIENWQKKNSIIIYLLVIFIFLVIVKIYFSFRFPTPFVFGDEYLYTDYAKEILQNPTSLFTQGPDQLYPPGYPVVLTPSFLFYPSVPAIYHAILAINIILSTLLLFISFCILKRYINEGDALLGSILITLLPFFTINNFIIFSENLYIPALVLACLLLIKSVEKKNPVIHLLTGIVFGFLPIIRVFGILALFSFYLIILYLLFINKPWYQEYIKERIYLIVTPSALFGSYIVIKHILSSNLYGYHSNVYFQVLEWMMSDLPSFFVFLKAFAAEIDYLILTTYLGFILFAAFLVFSWKKIDIPLKSLFLFTFSYSFFSMILTVLHMLTILRAPDYPSYSKYLIFGRYLDPALPLIFILGIIFLYNFLPERFKTGNPGKNIPHLITSSVLSCPKEVILSLIGISFFLIFTYPREITYKLVNVSAIYYLDYLSQYSEFFFWAVPIILFIPFFLLIRHPRYLMVTLILLSILITVPTFVQIENGSNHMNSLNVYEIISRDSDGAPGKTIYLDNETFKKPYAPDHCLIKFWGLTDNFYYTNDFSHFKIQPDYIISSRVLPFNVILKGPNKINIYKPSIAIDNNSNLNFEPKIENISNNGFTNYISISVWDSTPDI